MTTNLTTWLEFALQQMAAESYLDGINLQDDDTVGLRLTDGSNDTRIIQPDLSGNLPGKTRMTNVLVDRFLATYDIIDHHANDASGFSATLIKNTQTGEYTLSFRSTEPRPSLEGGDVERDGLFASLLTAAADGEIIAQGFAFAQLMAMERYFARIRQGQLTNGTTDPALKALFDLGGRINVTGFSLGGHLATVFTELHQDQVSQAYVFNAAGRGRMSGFSGLDAATLSSEEALIGQMLKRFTEILFSPDPASWSPPPTTGILAQLEQYHALQNAAQEAVNANPTWDPFRSGLGENLYLDPRYQWAKIATSIQYGTLGMAEVELQTGLTGIAATQGAFSRITQLYGLGATDDANAVAISGLFAGPANPVLIEGQPLLAREFGIPQFNESGSSHSITLIVDSLAVQELIQTIDSRYGQASAELLIRGASNERALGGVAPVDTDGVAESDSLEKIVDAFRKLLRDPALEAPAPLRSDSKVGGFANFTNRNAMYDAIQEVKDRVGVLQAQGVIFTLTDLTDPDVDRATLLARADVDTVEGLAYRYALKELNPFVVTTNSEFETGALHASFNTGGELDLFDPATGAGTFTTLYMDDRAAFLKEKLTLNQTDQDTSSGSIYYFDATQTYEIATADDPAIVRQFIFGSDADERFESGSKNDDLYGGGGVDLLVGNGGDDYLQGDGGGDQLEGGVGIDTLVGGAGNDILEGGSENDTLDGGLGTDILKGGIGIDRYIIRAIDGADTIEDSDGQGIVEFDDTILIGGLHRTGDASNVFHSADGTIMFTRNGADLVVTGSGPLTIKDFTNGQFGIRLVSETTATPATRTEFLKIDHYVQVGNLPDGTPIYEPVYAAFFDDNGNDTRSTAPIGGLVPAIGGEHNLIHALGGTDVILSGAGNDELYGEGGGDYISGGLGNDHVYGGAENDELYGDNAAGETGGGDDYLDGGEGNDVIQGGAGRDIVLGGGGNDHLEGDNPGSLLAGIYGDDYLDGGDGEEELHGGGGADVLIGGAGNDFLLGDPAISQGGTPEAGGADSLDGGSGNDWLDGQFGDDLLVGGLDDDILNGMDGADVLLGGDGNDQLSGDLRFEYQVAVPGYAMSEYRSAGGNDWLVGGQGFDYLTGGEGDDILEGNDDNDILYGDYDPHLIPFGFGSVLGDVGGNDVLDGGSGNDALYGGVENDNLDGGSGDDRLEGGSGADTLLGGAGDDMLEGQEGNDVLDGGAGIDQLDGGTGFDTLYGGEGDDRLVAGSQTSGSASSSQTFSFAAFSSEPVSEGSELLLVSEPIGADQLFGDAGDDYLISGNEYLDTDDSLLVGGSGDDTYEVDGLGDVLVEAAGEGNDSVISYLSAYTLADHFENLSFRGLATIGVGNSLDNVMSSARSLEGLDGNDTLNGAGRLDGGAGDDLLQGRSGISVFNDDTEQLEYVANAYVFRSGGGRDTIQENDALFNSAYYQNEDRVVFADGIAPSDVIWKRAGNDLILHVGAETDQITVPSFYDLRLDRGGYLLTGAYVPPEGSVFTPGGGFSTYVAPSRVELVEFADGTVWSADHFGAPLLGDVRADTYRFGRGSGEVTVLDLDVTQSNIDREQDRILIGAGVLPSDVTLERTATDDLVLSINGTSDRLTVQSFFKTITVIPPFSFSGYSVAAYRIEQVQFTDGTVWTVSDLFNRIATFVGTSGSDTLIGNPLDNLIQGLSGDDYLSGQGGDDVLDGGTGSDRLVGDAGNDTYLFGRGGGQDIVVSIDPSGMDTDVVLLGADILPSDVTIQVVGASNDLVLRINGTSDQVLFDEFLRRSDLQIDQLVFGDGTVWDAVTILDHAVGLTLTGTEADDTLRGSLLDDVLVGLDGNDVLVGNAGDDQLVGGLGDDILSGDEGDDTYVFNLGDGMDTIYDDVAPGEANRAMFGEGIMQSDLAFARDEAARTLTIQVGSGGTDQLVLEDFDPTGLDGSLVVSTLEFADGSVLNLAELFPLNQAPTVANGLVDQIVPEGVPVNLVVPADTFADVDAGDVLTYSASLANGGALPSWLSFDATTRTFSGTPDDAQVGSLELRVMATDLAQESVFDEFTLTVTNVNEAPILGAPLVDQTVNEDTAFIFTIPEGTFADVDQVHGDVLLYGASLSDGGSLPAWLTFDAATRTFSGRPDNGDVGAFDLVVTATDLGGLSVTGHLALTVENVNDAPTVVTPIADQTAAEDDPFSLTISADTFADDDARHGDVLSYQATLVDGLPLPAWLSFNSTTRTFSGIPGAGDAGTLQILVTATDATQVSVSDEFVLAISGPLPKTLVGTAGNDVLIGGRGHDTLSGLAGNDQLQGGTGNDLLDGGTGIDTMVGGTGNDSYVVNVGGDVVTELANEGTDTVQSSITYMLGNHVENLTLTGTTAINGTGNALDNTLTGNSGINVLTGGAGNDAYVVGAGDSVIENFNGGTDTILSAVTWTLARNVEHLTLTGSANVNGRGNVLNNTLMGNNGNNALDGGAGNDLLDGGAGNDSLLGGSGDDQLFGGLGTDVLNAGSGHDVLNGGEGADTLDGGSGGDQLFGGGGNDTMTGGSGADQFMGASGNDTMTGGSGNDVYTFIRGDDQDTIIDTDPFPRNQDRTVFGETINPLDLVISRQANDLRLTIHGSSDQITVQNWYTSPTANQIETIQAGNGKTLLNTQVDQLIQAMATFTTQTGLTWDQAIDQRPHDVQTVLAASWH